MAAHCQLLCVTRDEQFIDGDGLARENRPACTRDTGTVTASLGLEGVLFYTTSEEDQIVHALLQKKIRVA